MVYHAPYALNRQATSASGIRPVRMYDAFKSLGYEVLDVTGDGRRRRRAIKALKARLAAGQKIDFLYSESATIPTMLTEPRHLPPHPVLDVELFALARRYQIPAGLFYRDIYWKFGDYRERVGEPMATIMSAVYNYDLSWYKRYVDVLYLPSMAMGAHVPIFPAQRMAALPPGCELVDSASPDNGQLNLLYIGSVSGHYQLHECVRAVAATPGVNLTICTHQQQWEQMRGEYEPLMDSSVQVVHRSGAELEQLYDNADACVLFVQPDPYREFAAPVKLFEYLGHGKPVIASAGTLAAQVVADNEAGWVAPYGGGVLPTLLSRLQANPQEVNKLHRQAKAAGKANTWAKRAQQVAFELGQKGAKA